MEKSDWPEIKNQLRRIHPVMSKKLADFEDALVRATHAAKAYDPEGVPLAIEACKLSVVLCSDVEHLNAVGIISEERGPELKDGIEAYATKGLRQIFVEFSTCRDKAIEAQIITKLIEQASELDPRWQEKLVGFAQEVRQIDISRQSSG